MVDKQVVSNFDAVQSQNYKIFEKPASSESL